MVGGCHWGCTVRQETVCRGLEVFFVKLNVTCIWKTWFQAKIKRNTTTILDSVYACLDFWLRILVMFFKSTNPSFNFIVLSMVHAGFVHCVYLNGLVFT